VWYFICPDRHLLAIIGVCHDACVRNLTHMQHQKCVDVFKPILVFGISPLRPGRARSLYYLSYRSKIDTCIDLLLIYA
jgi:hypothetical protein